MWVEEMEELLREVVVGKETGGMEKQRRIRGIDRILSVYSGEMRKRCGYERRG